MEEKSNIIYADISENEKRLPSIFLYFYFSHGN